MNLSLSMLPALETQSWSILFEDFTAVSALLLLCGKYALLGWCEMSQSFIHFLKTLLIIWGPPSVVMGSGTFQVAQKSLMIAVELALGGGHYGVLPREPVGDHQEVVAV